MFFMQNNSRQSLSRLAFLFSLLSVLCINGYVQASHGTGKHPELAAALPQSISTALQQNPELQLFATALKASDLWESVMAAENITLFVPSDKVLRQEGSAFLLEVVLLKHENSERLSNLMAQHVFPWQEKPIDVDSLTSTTSFSNLFGGCVSVDPVSDGALRIGPEAVVTSQQSFSNGKIFYIDRLLWQHYQGINTCYQ